MSRCQEGQHRLTLFLQAWVQAQYEDSLIAWADYRAALSSYRIHNKNCIVCHERMELDQGVVVPHGEPVQEEINMDLALEIAREKLYQTIQERM